MQPRFRARARAALILIFVALPALSASGQAQEPEGAAPSVDAYERDTPRSSVHAYLVAARAGEWDQAARYLDLAGLPESRRARQGPVLARHLKVVLDRNLWVDLESLSQAPEGDPDDGLPAGRDRVGWIDSSTGRVAISLARVHEQGEPVWKFSPATVARVPALYDEFGYGPLGDLLPPVFFDTTVLEVQLWQWIGLLVLVLGAFIASWGIAWVVSVLLQGVAARSATHVDDRVFAAAIGPVRLAAGVVVFWAGVLALDLSVPAERFFVESLKVLAVVAATWFVLRLVDVFGGLVVQRMQERERDASVISVVPLGLRTIKAFIVVLASLAALDSFGFDVTALIAGLGVGGLAVALAAQKTVENLFGGVTLIADRPVKIGDFCRFGDKVGTVEEIGLRSTRVRTLDRTLLTIPNAEFSALQLENFAARDKIWFHPTIGLLYDTTPDQMRYVLVEVRRMLYAHPKVDPDPARIRFTSFGPYSLDLDIFAYVTATDYGQYLEIAEDLNLRIMDIVAESGTAFAFPSNTTYLAQDSGVDADRTRKAEAQVREWRERGELYLPGFPPERIEALRGTLDYPNAGTPWADPADGSGS